MQQAVAASCAIPGLFPPVTIAGRRFMDGGMASMANAHLADGCAVVVVLTPISAGGLGTPPGIGQVLEREVAALREAGSRVLVIGPDAEAKGVMGMNLMDVTRRVAAAKAGQRQAAALAAEVAALWG